MYKADYLKDESVSSFVSWLVMHIKSPTSISVSNQFHAAKLRKDFSFLSLEDALKKYTWNFPEVGQQFEKGSSFAENERALGILQSQLLRALEIKDHDALTDACTQVFKWGGVSNRNSEWARTNKKSLYAELNAVKDIIKNGTVTLDKKSFSFRFNAGMTKIYSLIVPNFIIYDSRVAGTLAWLVLAWLKDSDQGTVPATLVFPCMSAKESANAKFKKTRNPNSHIFPTMNNRHELHAAWNIKASWIFEDVIKKIAGSDNLFTQLKDPIRGLEAAMFMWGYDLSNAKYQDQLVS
jgi:hypothetical protein